MSLHKLVIYSLREHNGEIILSWDYTSLIREVELDKHIIIDVPVTGLKKFVWYPYIVKSHIFDNGSVFFMIANYKSLNHDYVLSYLKKYVDDGRPNIKDYSLPKPKKITPTKL